MGASVHLLRLLGTTGFREDPPVRLYSHGPPVCFIAPRPPGVRHLISLHLRIPFRLDLTCFPMTYRGEQLARHSSISVDRQ